jgi:hypothetical protein
MLFAPAEVYPVELRGIMLIENTSRSVRRAPEVRNKKILVLLVNPHSGLLVAINPRIFSIIRRGGA